jgi:myo-inositol-1(or 4)-monophosphatase
MSNDNGSSDTRSGDMPDVKLLRDIERAAVDLVRLAATAIESALGRELAVRYKNLGDSDSYRDPVSEVDQEVELLIRSHLAQRFSDHDILGEESEERPGRDHDFVWAIDPIDGTTNFVNGFPLFASSIGVLFRGRPVVGAVWCSATHALRPGVYHARRGGGLYFDNELLRPRLNAQVRRHLAGAPEVAADGDLPWEIRKTGSASVECAFAAAGLLRVARFAQPNVWDVAGGVVLVEEAGGEVRIADEGRWQPFVDFTPRRGNDDGTGEDLRYWRSEMVVGEPGAVGQVCSNRTPI